MTIHLISTIDSSKWPPIWFKCLEIWQKSSYNIKVWDKLSIEAELKLDDESFYNEYLHHLDEIYQVDYVRYIILEKYGGAYFDLDIEIVNDFFPLLKDNKAYIMEGTCGTYVENSIMIAPHNSNKEMWNRVKLFTKNNIILKFKECRADKYNVIKTVGAMALSEFCLRGFPQELDPRGFFDILSFEHFANIKSSLSFSRHHQTGMWN